MDKKENNKTSATVAIVTKSYYDYECSVEIVGKVPTQDELSLIAEEIYDLADSGDYTANECDWDLVEAKAEIDDNSDAEPRYRAIWVGDQFKVEEID